MVLLQNRFSFQTKRHHPIRFFRTYANAYSFIYICNIALAHNFASCVHSQDSQQALRKQHKYLDAYVIKPRENVCTNDELIGLIGNTELPRSGSQRVWRARAGA